MRITVAGASGFVGKNLLNKLGDKFILRALSRSNKESLGGIEWCEADLFSFNSTLKALENTDVAIYLVHSMLPSSKLFQGNFQDTDLFLADNFSKACVQNNVKQIIYLGGLTPETGISKHLESRREVEDVLKSSGIPVTILRAGMVVGDGGSSFEILKNLVSNLPFMVLPSWTKSKTQTIYIDDLINVIIESIDNELFFNQTINVVNGEKITYEKLIRQTSKHLGKKESMIPVPINYSSFSKLWVKFFGETDYELVSPLIDSLLCDLPAPEIPALIEKLVVHRTFESMLVKIPKEKLKHSKMKRKSTGNTVRSIQRLSNCSMISEKKICDEYLNWLPRYMKHFIKANTIGNKVLFLVNGTNLPLLILERIEKDDPLDRIKFHIVGGALSKTKDTGWLEFRVVANGKYTLASINEFIPSLPWYLYRYTQAIMHAKVMNAFSSHLAKMKVSNV